MASTALHSLLDIQHASGAVTSPPAAHRKDHSAAQGAHAGTELTNFKPKTHHVDLDGQNDKISTDLPSGTQPAETPLQLEMSRSSSPVGNEVVNLMQSWNNPAVNKWRILCCCLIYFGNGLNDSVIGALIPYMEDWYHIGYAVMSIIFVGNAAGFIAAAFFTNVTLHTLGRAKSLALSETLLIVGYTMLVATPAYPVVVISFFLLGYGAATSLALNNVYCANLRSPSVILGAVHGSYGIGGIVAPIIGTSMASKGIIWSRFYFICLGLRVCCLVFAAWSFWSYEEDSPQTTISSIETNTNLENPEDVASKSRNLKLALKNRVTICGALFIFAYQGAEVSISGWVISFLINYRDGDPTHVGYVTAGFWGGITLGRFILVHFAPRFGEKNFVLMLTVGALGFQLLVWLIPNVIGNAVAVAFLGLLLGPVYPCAQAVFSRLMPRHVQTTAIGFIGSAGSSGGAVAPFTTGILAQAVGTWVLHPVCIGLYVVMLAFWLSLPHVRKRTE